MRLVVVFRKTLVETERDVAVLAMTLLLAPVFVFALYGFYGGEQRPLPVAVCDRDRGTGARELLAAVRGVKMENGRSVFAVTEVRDLSKGQGFVEEREAHALLEIPLGYSAAIAQRATGAVAPTTPTLILHGDVGDPAYVSTAALLESVARSLAERAAGTASPVAIRKELLGSAVSRTEFELFVPGLLVFAMIMVIFTAAIAVIREVDKGTIRRLQMSPLRTSEFLGAVSLVQVLVSVAALLIALVAAVAVGYRLEGSLTSVLVIGALTSFSVTAIGLITAAFCRTTGDVLIVGNFPFFLLLFFTGMMFPAPAADLAAIGGHTVGLPDLLPPTHTVVALNEILNHSAGLADVLFELVALLLLTVVYFAAGVVLFRGRHMRLG